VDVLKLYREFLKVDLQLKESTIEGHICRARKFLDALNTSLEALTVQDIREYLSTLSELNLSTYSNVVKSLRRFIRDFLGKTDLMKTFKLPYVEFQPKMIPTKEQIRGGYYALRTDKQRLIYLLYAVTGLRHDELRNLKLSDIDLETRSIRARHDSLTKRSFCTFWNDEADVLLRKYLNKHMSELDENGGRLFNFSWSSLYRMRRLTENKIGVRITPRVLRAWFCSEMLSKGVQEVYVDAFCGRVPRSVLARHYTDFSPDRLKEIYDKAGLNVLV
jgi:integrase